MAHISMKNREYNCEDDLNDLTVDLLNLRGALELLAIYFQLDKNYARENISLLLVQYMQYGALTNVCIEALDNILNKSNI